VAINYLCQIPSRSSSLPHRKLRLTLTLVLSASCGLSVISTIGCSSKAFGGPGTSSTPLTTSTSLGGIVNAGREPVVGSLIQIYAAGSNGVASSAQPILSGPLYSDNSGAFTATFTCPAASPQIYIVAQGGAVSPTGTRNSAIALMSALGTCNALLNKSSVLINEVATVGSVWPLSPFMSDVSHVGSSQNDASFTAAHSLITQLVDLSNGSSPGTSVPVGYAVQTAKLNALANAIHACAISAGGQAGDGSPCGLLFSITTPSNGIPPANTVDAALQIAKSPGQNITAIFNLTALDGQFQPAIAAVPTDWDLALLPIPAPPSIAPSAGAYNPGQPISITDSTTGAVIHFTTDGTAALATSPVYSAPFSLLTTATVNAIAVLDDIASPIASSSFEVIAAHLAFSTQPISTSPNSVLNPPPSVAVFDANGNLLDSINIPITISLSASAASPSLTGTATVSTVNGIATFTDLSFPVAQVGAVLTATAPGIPPATSAPFNISMPTMSFALPATNISLGSSMNSSIILAQPAGVGGATVTLSSSTPIVDLSTSVIQISAGQTSAVFSVRALDSGTTTLTATATGFSPATSQSISIAPVNITGAPTVTTIESLGTVPASQPASGLGFNIDSQQSWEFQKAQALGSTWVRLDCPWLTTEIQNADNTSGGYTLPSSCVAGLANSKSYGLNPQVNALYGPPSHHISTLNVITPAAIGSYALGVSSSVADSLATLATACFDSQSKPLCEVTLNSGAQLSSRWDYAGTLVTAVDSVSGTISLAAATTVALTASNLLTINQVLYSPILVPTGGAFLTDPSTQAYVNYARYLASQIQAAGISGEVGLYNEPNWAGGLWVHGEDLWDQPSRIPAAYLPTDSVNVGVPLAVAATTPIAGVKFMSNFTNKTGFGAVLGSSLFEKYTTIGNLQQNIASEAFHPYGNNPEDLFWSPACLSNEAQTNGGKFVSSCALPGGTIGSNIAYALLPNFIPSFNGGIPHSITETGLGQQISDVTPRFDLRQFIGYQALGISPILFYKLSNSGQGYDWVNYSTHEQTQVYSDFLPLMQDIKSIGLPPISPGSDCSTPTVTSYVGYFPLDVAMFVGTKSATDQTNSVLFFTWQRTYVTSGTWYQMASPSSVPVTVAVPAGMTVAKVTDTVTLASVPYSLNAASLTYSVADNPIEILLTPIDSSIPPSACGSSSTQGQSMK
jgi:hypothetical protein